jgi:hypothetical protein
MVGAANATETTQIPASMNKTVFRLSRSQPTLGKTMPHKRFREMTIRLSEPERKNVTTNEKKKKMFYQDRYQTCFMTAAINFSLLLLRMW